MALQPLKSLYNEICYTVIMELVPTIAGICARRTVWQLLRGVTLAMELLLTACPIDSLNIGLTRYRDPGHQLKRRAELTVRDIPRLNNGERNLGLQEQRLISTPKSP